MSAIECKIRLCLGKSKTMAETTEAVITDVVSNCLEKKVIKANQDYTHEMEKIFDELTRGD